MSIDDSRYMKRAIALARKGLGKTSPNPMVGAVIVKGGAIIGEGYHRTAGSAHAEVVAMQAAGGQLAGATLYTTLEPCCHLDKKTPPCVASIIQSGIRRIVAAMTDPNPKVSGRGFRKLMAGGVQVTKGIAQDEAKALNAIYIKYITTRKPYVILKAAMTLDGKMAAKDGVSRWISGDDSRRDAHRLRARVDAVMVGVGTVKVDDPLLTARLVRPGRLGYPIRVILDPHLKTPIDAKVVTTGSDAPTWIFTTTDSPIHRRRVLERKNVRIIVLPSKKGRMTFDAILSELGDNGITSVLIEGGGTTFGVALRAGIVDRVILYLAPKLLCGDDAYGMATGASVLLPHALQLHHLTVKRMGVDIRVEGEVARS